MLKCGIFASGNGSNFQAILDASLNKEIDIEVKVLVCNNKDAYVIERAKEHNIDVILIDYKTYTKEVIENDLINKLKQYNLDYIFLAGFLRIFSANFIKTYPNRIINIHPSLLPKYKGLYAIEQALENKDDIIGITVHYVNEELDSGQIILQEKINVKKLSKEEAFETIHKHEHKLYIKAINKVVKENE